MIHHPVRCHFFVFCSWLAVVGVGIDGQSAARREFSPYFDIAGVHQFDQIIHDDVDDIFVEISMIPEAE